MNSQSNYKSVKHDSTSLYVGDEICLIRFVCDLETLSQLFYAAQYLEGTNDSLISSLFEINYFRYNKGNKRRIFDIYNENKNSTEFFEYNKKEQFIIDSDRRSFLNANLNNKIIIWEPTFPPEKKGETDVAYFQYFLLILTYMKNKGYRYNICISAGEYSGLKYNPIDYGDKVSRLRTFLYFYSNEDLSKIYIFSKYIKNDSTDKEKETKVIEIEWQHIKAKKGNDEYLDFGKIFPLITITPDVFKSLVLTPCTQNAANDEWDKRLFELYKSYIRRYLRKKHKLDRKSKIMTSLVRTNGFYDFEKDSLLEGLIFVSTLVYLEEYTLTDTSRRKDLIRLHEICVDYAQGIAQLLENIVYHVVRNSNNGSYEGCGSFTFRIRNKSNANYYISEDDGDICNFSNFMELYVVDLNFGQFDGFVNKFVENVKTRGDKWANILENNVFLPQLFGENLPNSNMANYFNNGENIAMHYGLQILNSVVMTGEGCLYMSSGSLSDLELTEKNSFFNEYKVDSYSNPKFLWRNGTAYIIYLPIKYEETVNYSDVIFISNLECNDNIAIGTQLLVDSKCWETVALTAEDKNKSVIKVKNELLKNVDSNKIYYIDISCITLNHIYAYEVLSKALFLMLHEGKINDIVLINIPKKYDVIKVFRHFALFYNRYGENLGMEGKSVYLINADGTLDLLLYGSKLNSIKENFAFNKIYGGYSDEAMEIIKHLCDRTERKNNGRKS